MSASGMDTQVDGGEQVDPNDVDMLNPNLRPEDQDVDMVPVVLTPGAYASPDPATSGQRMVALTEAAELGVEVSADYAQAETEAAEGGGEEAPQEEGFDYNSMTAADLKAEADSRGLSYPSNASKSDLVALLEEDDAKP